MKRILYIQHATSLGGSVLSLLGLVQKLDRKRFEPVVACIGAGTEIPDFYRQNGIESFACPDLAVFPHTTGGWYSCYNPRALWQLALVVMRFPRIAGAAKRLVKQVKPDLIHLNSVVLGPCAVGVARTGVPLVWHVRESVVSGHFGFRRWLIQQWLLRLPKEIIFISSAEKKQLLEDKRGIVIPNFVDFEQFDRNLNGQAMRQSIGLKSDDQVVLFLGGFWNIKGARPLLKALAIEHQRNYKMHAIFASAIATPSTRLVARIGRMILPLLGHPTDRQWATKFMRQYAMESYVHLLPFQGAPEQLLAACDVLVFPSIAPHFARPVIEAGAMGKAVVASRLGGVMELVEENQTGILVPPGDVHALADALHQVLNRKDEAARMGENGFQRARDYYNAEHNAQQIMTVYAHILGLEPISPCR